MRFYTAGCEIHRFREKLSECPVCKEVHARLAEELRSTRRALTVTQRESLRKRALASRSHWRAGFDPATTQTIRIKQRA